MEIVYNFFLSFAATLCEMAPFLLIGFGFAGLLYAFLPQNTIHRYFGGSPLGSATRAALLGVPLPLCSCGIIPTSMAFYKNGASKGSTVSLLIATPQTGVDSILATYSMMGLPFAIMRPIVAFITGIAGGWIEGIREQKEDGNTSDSIEIDNNENYFNKDSNIKGGFVDKFMIALKYGFHDFLGDIAKWLLVGLVLAAAISALIPKDFIASLNLPPIIQMLLVLIIAIPLYVCATGSIPLAASFIAVGMNPGAAFVFLMAGPATNAATITVLNKILGKKTLITYLTSIIIGAVAGGLLITYILPPEWFAYCSPIHCHNCIEAEQLGPVSIISGILLAALIAFAFINKYIQSRKIHKKMRDNMQTQQTATFKVDNMTCSHCKATVEKVSLNVAGTETAIADLQSKTLTVCGTSFDPQEVIKAIEAAGYIIHKA